LTFNVTGIFSGTAMLSLLAVLVCAIFITRMSRQGPTNDRHSGSERGSIEVSFRWRAPDRLAPNCAHLRDVAPADKRCIQRNTAEIKPICALRRAVRLRKKQASALRDKLLSWRAAQ